MEIKVFKPKVKEQERFAVAVPTDKGIMAIIQTYASKEQLETGYKHWKEDASQKGLTKPYPIEILDKDLKCKILEDLL